MYSDSVPDEVRNIKAPEARRLMVIIGIAILILSAGNRLMSDGPWQESVGVLLYAPVILAMFYGKRGAGIATGLAVGVIYAALRFSNADEDGWFAYGALVAFRTASYLALGMLGPVMQRVAGALTRLEFTTVVDDVTGLNNARFFLQDTEVELSRAKRYSTVFSVVVVDIPDSVLDSVDRRKHARALRDLSRALNEAVRTVDRVAYVIDGTTHRLAMVLPETPRDGAIIFTKRFALRVTAIVNALGGSMDVDDIELDIMTYPENVDELDGLRARFAAAWLSGHEEVDEAVVY